MESMMIYVPIVMALIGLAFMAIKRSWVLKQDAGDGKDERNFRLHLRRSLSFP